MIFTNANVIRSDNDLVIGGAHVQEEKISFNNYMLALENRILKLIIQSVKDEYDGIIQKADAIERVRNFVYTTLTIKNKRYSTDEEGLMKEILSADEFFNWSAGIWYNFKNIHLGVINRDTPVEVSSENKFISEEFLQELKDNDTLSGFCHALAATNNID